MKKSLLALAIAVSTLAPLAAANAASFSQLSTSASAPTVLNLGATGTASPSLSTSAAVSFGNASSIDYYFELASPASVLTSFLGSDSTYHSDSSYISLVGGSTVAGSSLNAVQFGAPQSASFNLTPGTEYELVVSGTPNTSFTANVSAAPEPATWALMVFGIGAIGVAMRRSRRAARGALVAA